MLLIKRSAEPHKDTWSLPGGLLTEGEYVAAKRPSRRLEIETGVKDVFLEQLYTFSDLDDAGSIAVAYWALVDRDSARLARRDEWQPAWCDTDDLPELAFHNDRGDRLRGRAAAQQARLLERDVFAVCRRSSRFHSYSRRTRRSFRGRWTSGTSASGSSRWRSWNRRGATPAKGATARRSCTVFGSGGRWCCSGKAGSQCAAGAPSSL